MKRNLSSPASCLNAFRDVWLIWIALAFLTTLPYVTAALRTPTGYSFSGVLTAYDDTFTYFAWMRQGVDGHVLMSDPFTSEPQPKAFFLPLWYALGFVAGVTGLSIPLTFHAARLLAALVLLIVARRVAGCVMKSRTRVRYTLWLYAMSAGFGWLIYLIKNKSGLFDATDASGSIDLTLPEAIAFRSVFSQVHFIVGASLVCGAITLFFGALVDRKTTRAFVAGVLTSLLAVVHPYMVVVVGGVAGAAFMFSPWLTCVRNRAPANYYGAVRPAIVFCAGAIPGVAYLFYLNRSNEVLREWLRVTDTFSPPPWEYAYGFGLVAALAVVGFRLIWNRHFPYGRLLLIWAVVQSALLYAPTSIQRRFVEGLQLPLSIAASLSLFWIARRLLTNRVIARYRRPFLVAAIAMASLTNIGFIIGQLAAASARSAATDPRRYVEANLVAAFDWLRTNAATDAVLFSSYMTGNVAPSMTGLHVFFGHYAQTLRSDEKGAQVAAFYGNAMTDNAARELFAEHRIRYIVYGQFEREISKDFVAPSWLRLVYQNGDIEIYTLTDDADPGGISPPRPVS